MALGQRAGLTQGQIDGLDTYETNSVYSEDQEAVIRYAEEMTNDVSVSDKTFERVRKVLNDQALVELSMTIAFANFTNRLNETFQTDLEH